MEISFTVPGEAQGKRRQRARWQPGRSGKAGFVQTYAEPEGVKYEKLICTCGEEALDGAPPLTGALHLDIRVRITPPASTSKVKRSAMLDRAIYPTGKPDLDNVAKAILDGLNKRVIVDDAKVVRIAAIKVYAETPGVDVTVRNL